jgi:large subunit ribosomal protein L35Ae
MKGTIANFRRGRRTQKPNQLIIYIDEIDSKKKAEKLIGKKVSWTSPGKNKTTINGKITSSHGNKGAVRALFERGIPGQALGKEIDIE